MPDVVGDLAADCDVCLCLPATIPVVFLVLEEPGPQDLRLVVQDDHECILDFVPHPGLDVHNPPACLQAVFEKLVCAVCLGV